MMMAAIIEFCHFGFSHFAQKRTFTHSFWLNLMMAAILNSAKSDSASAILDSDTLFSSLTFTQKHSLSALWLWLKLIQSDSNSFMLTQLDDGSHLQFCHLEFGQLGFSHLSISLSNSFTLNKIGSHHLHKKTLLFHSQSTWWWQQSYSASILNSAILNSAILHKKTSLVHSDSTWWWQPSWTLPCWIQTLAILDSDTLVFPLKLTHNC